MFPHRSDQMSQRLQVSGVALCMPKVKVSQLVTRSPIELFRTGKKHKAFMIVSHIAMKVIALIYKATLYSNPATIYLVSYTIYRLHYTTCN